MARHPTMRTADGRWQVEVITGRTGQQSFRVRRLDRVPGPGSTGMPMPGTVVASIDQVRDLLGDAFGTLSEVRRGAW